MNGKVIFYDRQKGWGMIRAEELEKQVFVHRSAVTVGRGFLADGEAVSFEVVEAEKGLQARKVTLASAAPRFTGTVEKFESGFGFVRVDGEVGTAFVHHSEILSSGFRMLELGEKVEFELDDGEKGKVAKNIVRLDTRYPLEKFSHLGNFDAQIEALAGLAQQENWDYTRQKATKPHPVMHSYVHYTFMQLQKEEKIAQARDAKGMAIACFNTGLVTEMQEEIFAYFTANKGKTADQPWCLSAFCKQSDRHLSHFPKMPEPADYFRKASDLVYDSDRQLVVDYDHVISDNMARFPKEMASSAYGARMALEGALKSALKRVKRNYKTAVPQFYRGELQLLLPLCLRTPKEADLALVVERENEVYRASTVLTLDMAYNNARLLARPDREWLDP